MFHIGAKDNLDRALVRQYANAKTSNLDSDIRIDSEELWQKMNMLSVGQKMHITLIKNLKKIS